MPLPLSAAPHLLVAPGLGCRRPRRVRRSRSARHGYRSYDAPDAAGLHPGRRRDRTRGRRHECPSTRAKTPSDAGKDAEGHRDPRVPGLAGPSRPVGADAGGIVGCFACAEDKCGTQVNACVGSPACVEEGICDLTRASAAPGPPGRRRHGGPAVGRARRSFLAGSAWAALNFSDVQACTKDRRRARSSQRRSSARSRRAEPVPQRARQRAAAAGLGWYSAASGGLGGGLGGLGRNGTRGHGRRRPASRQAPLVRQRVGVRLASRPVVDLEARRIPSAAFLVRPSAGHDVPTTFEPPRGGGRRLAFGRQTGFLGVLAVLPSRAPRRPTTRPTGAQLSAARASVHRRRKGRGRAALERRAREAAARRAGQAHLGRPLPHRPLRGAPRSPRRGRARLQGRGRPGARGERERRAPPRRPARRRFDRADAPRRRGPRPERARRHGAPRRSSRSLRGSPSRPIPGTHTIEAQRARAHAPSVDDRDLQERDAASRRSEARPTTPSPPASGRRADASEPREVVPRSAENHAASRHRTLALVAAAGAGGPRRRRPGRLPGCRPRARDAVRACAQMVSIQADACDSGKNAVRAWDWISVGAWAGAAAAGTVAVVSLVSASAHDPRTRPRGRGPPSPSPRGCSSARGRWASKGPSEGRCGAKEGVALATLATSARRCSRAARWSLASISSTRPRRADGLRARRGPSRLQPARTSGRRPRPTSARGPPDEAQQHALHACTWLGACETPMGNNAFGPCYFRALLAYDCAANPNHRARAGGSRPLGLPPAGEELRRRRRVHLLATRRPVCGDPGVYTACCPSARRMCASSAPTAAPTRFRGRGARTARSGARRAPASAGGGVCAGQAAGVSCSRECAGTPCTGASPATTADRGSTGASTAPATGPGNAADSPPPTRRSGWRASPTATRRPARRTPPRPATTAAPVMCPSGVLETLDCAALLGSTSGVRGRRAVASVRLDEPVLALALHVRQRLLRRRGAHELRAGRRFTATARPRAWAPASSRGPTRVGAPRRLRSPRHLRSCPGRKRAVRCDIPSHARRSPQRPPCPPFRRPRHLRKLRRRRSMQADVADLSREGLFVATAQPLAVGKRIVARDPGGRGGAGAVARPRTGCLDSSSVAKATIFRPAWP